jgi:hypothetical protein
MTKRTHRNARVSSGLAMVLLAASAGAAPYDCRYTAQRSASIDTSGAQRIEVVGRAGDLDLRPGAGSVVAGHGTACASSEEYLAQTHVHARRDGDVVRVYVQTPDDMKGIGLIYATLDLTVDVPAGFPVQVTDTSGDLTARDLRITQLTDSSGDIRLRGMRGDIDIRDSSGELRVEETDGRVRINDSSGDIIVRGARDVEIPSDSSGDIEIERVAGGVRIDQDSSGDIRISGVGRNVELLADSSGEVIVHDVKGSVSVP